MKRWCMSVILNRGHRRLRRDAFDGLVEAATIRGNGQTLHYTIRQVEESFVRVMTALRRRLGAQVVVG